VLNIVGGFGGALLVESEIRGFSAINLTAIVDSHYVTSETMQGYGDVLTQLLDIKNIDLGQIHTFKKFKEVLKEENNRGNNIYN